MNPIVSNADDNSDDSRKGGLLKEWLDLQMYKSGKNEVFSNIKTR